MYSIRSFIAHVVDYTTICTKWLDPKSILVEFYEVLA